MNKEICKSCMARNRWMSDGWLGQSKKINHWNATDEARWAVGTVLCECGTYLENSKSIERNASKIREECPYYLEHVMAAKES
jgi:hypothetical protein